MKVLEGIERIRKIQNAHVTIGNFDGLHLGHKAILIKLLERAETNKGQTVLVTFDPHPLSVLKPEKIKGLLTPLPVKKKLIEGMMIDFLVILKFDETVKEMEAEDFVRNILLEKIGTNYLLIGSDFRFGKDAKGDVDLLRQLSRKYKFSFESLDPIKVDGEKIGSNMIRNMVLEGDLERVRKYLGRPFSIFGKVLYGAGLGKKIGFPTANISLYEDQILPKKGVYATEVELKGRYFYSVTNVGSKPTFNYNTLSVETHILDFSEEIYGTELEVIFHKRIRDEEKFRSVDDLKRAIERDVTFAREYFRRFSQ